MEVPIYYTFKGFKENYLSDLEKWLNIYIDGEEKDFLERACHIYITNIFLKS